MREDESNWFSKWEDELPSPEELMPLSQTLISPDLALAFNIQNPQTEFDSSDFNGGEEPARTLKRPRLVWTPQLHKRFVDAVAHLGIKNAVPKTIMQLMQVDGLTRENVASHLQKYRLYLKRMQGISSGSVVDSVTDRLFASSPVPPHFLQVAAVQQQQLPHGRHVAMGAGNSRFPAQIGQMGFFGGQPNGQMENMFLASRQVHGVHRSGAPSYVEDVDSGSHVNGRKVLTLFPTGEE